MLPLHDDNPVERRAVLTWLIIAACVYVFLVWQPTPGRESVEDVEFYLRDAAIPCEVTEGRPLTYAEANATFGQGNSSACGTAAPTAADAQAFDPGKNVWLAVLTSMFLHGGFLHIGFNLLVLWVFGNNVEDVLGKIGFAVLYVVGGIVATLSHVMLDPGSTVPVVGASGAIAAVMGTYLVLFPHARVLTAVFMVLITAVRIPAAIVLTVWFVLQFFTGPESGVAWGAHVGGFVFGVLVGAAVRATRGPELAARRQRLARLR